MITEHREILWYFRRRIFGTRSSATQIPVIGQCLRRLQIVLSYWGPRIDEISKTLVLLRWFPWENIPALVSSICGTRSSWSLPWLYGFLVMHIFAYFFSTASLCLRNSEGGTKALRRTESLVVYLTWVSGNRCFYTILRLLAFIKYIWIMEMNGALDAVLKVIWSTRVVSVLCSDSGFTLRLHHLVKGGKYHSWIFERSLYGTFVRSISSLVRQEEMVLKRCYDATVFDRRLDIYLSYSLTVCIVFLNIPGHHPLFNLSSSHIQF